MMDIRQLSFALAEGQQALQAMQSIKEYTNKIKKSERALNRNKDNEYGQLVKKDIALYKSGLNHLERSKEQHLDNFFNLVHGLTENQ